MTRVKDMIKKVILLGDGAVGKTSLVRRYVLDIFDDKYIATIGIKTSAKSIRISTGDEIVNIILQIWDVLGQKGYSKLHQTNFRGTNGVLLVADITRKDTLVSLEDYWIPKIQYLVGDVPVVLMANKYDLMKFAEVKKEDLREFAIKYNFPFYLTSAKNGQNVEMAFKTLSQRMIEPQDDNPQFPSKITITHPKKLFGGKIGKANKVLDRIFDDFCRGFNNPEDAMPVIRKQCELSGLDIQNPTKKAMLILIEKLNKIEKTLLKREVVKANYEKRLKWINECNSEDSN